MNNVKTNLEILVVTYKHWYKLCTALFWAKDLKPLSDEWIKLGLNVTDKEFTGICILNTRMYENNNNNNSNNSNNNNSNFNSNGLHYQLSICSDLKTSSNRFPRCK